ncbi:unnamed protein product, partial [Ectocarpus sp. 13 AM-2016]
SECITIPAGSNMSGIYPRQWADRKKQQAPARKRRLVTYTMQPLNEQPGHRFGVNRILRLGEDSLLSAGRDGVIRLWDVSSMLDQAAARGSAGGGRRDDADDADEHQPQHPQPPCTGVFASHTDWVTGLAVAEGRIMASASYDGTLKLWDLAAADRARNTDKGGREAAAAAAAAAAVVAARRMEVGGRDEEDYRRWGLGGRGEEAAGEANGSGTGMHGVQDAAARAAASNRRTPPLPPPPPPPRPSALATVAGHGDYVKCLTYAEQHGVLVSGGLDKRILLWDLQRMSAPLMVLRGGSGAADGGGSDGGWGAGAGSASNNAMMNSAGYSPAAGRQLGGGQRQGAGAPWLSDEGEGGWTHLRDPLRVALRAGQAAAGPNEVLELCRQNKGSVHCVAAAADASLVASGGTDRMIRLLDPRAGGGQAAKVCKLDGHGDNVRCVKIDEGGTRVVSGSSDGTIRVWDVRQQCCLGVYELPGGSVWAMQPSPCDLDVYYSGGRGRRVYRTDFRTGESSLVCVTDSEVLDMELELGRGGGTDSTGPYEQPMSMWLSSTQPHIALWGGEASGGGLALRSGRPAASAVVTAAAADGDGDRAEEDDMDMDVFDVTPPFAEYPAEGEGEAGGMGGEGGGCLL